MKEMFLPNRKTARRAVTALLLAAALLLSGCAGVPPLPEANPETPRGDSAVLDEKLDALRPLALDPDFIWQLGEHPAGDAGYAVLLSVCDGETRAHVFSAGGMDAETAFDAAAAKAREAVVRENLDARWVRADMVTVNDYASPQQIAAVCAASEPNSLRFGLALGRDFSVAMPEGEVNAFGILRCGEDAPGVNREALNACLQQRGLQPLTAQPAELCVFQTAGFFCGEDGVPVALEDDMADFGHRVPAAYDRDFFAGLIGDLGRSLAARAGEDGRFDYGVYAASMEPVEGYSVVHHAGALWSLIQAYEVTGDAEIAAAADRALSYLLEQIVMRTEDSEDAEEAGDAEEETVEDHAYVLDRDSGELKLGAAALTVTCLTEYARAFDDHSHDALCHALGLGLLSVLDPETGVFYHVLNPDYTLRETYRTASYDGQAVFALCRLYGLEENELWLNAARIAMSRMLNEKYTSYGSHWVSYSLNELTRYVTDETALYAVTLDNVELSLEELIKSPQRIPANLELLMASFETYDRIRERVTSLEGFDEAVFLLTIGAYTRGQLDAVAFPETAMYFPQPGRVLYAGLDRQNDFRARIDDTQHLISAYYLIWKNADRLALRGVL